jgi:hypothetical protein
VSAHPWHHACAALGRLRLLAYIQSQTRRTIDWECYRNIGFVSVQIPLLLLQPSRQNSVNSCADEEEEEEEQVRKTSSESTDEPRSPVQVDVMSPSCMLVDRDGLATFTTAVENMLKARNTLKRAI